MKTLQQSSTVSTSFISVLWVLGVGGVFFVSSPPVYADSLADSLHPVPLVSDASFLAQSTDGSAVLVRTTDDTPALVVHDASSSVDEVVVRGAGLVPGESAMSGDGAVVAFETYDAPKAQYILTLSNRSTHTAVHIANSPQSMNPALSDDGTVVVFRKFDGTNSQLFKHTTRNGSTALIASQEGEMSDISITPDGSFISLRRTTDSSGRAARVELYDASKPGSAGIPVSDGDITPYSPTISNDGRYVAYIAKDTRGTWWYTPTRRVMIYDRVAATSTDAFDSPDLSDVVSISGDGRYVAYRTVGSSAITLYMYDTQNHRSAKIVASGLGVGAYRKMLGGNGASIMFDTSEHLVAGYGGRSTVYKADNPLYEAAPHISAWRGLCSATARSLSDFSAEKSRTPESRECEGLPGDNVLFLPGFEASRLYEGDKKLWEPVGDASVEHLRIDIHANIQARDVIDKAYGQFGVYDVFFDRMNTLKQSGVIADWKAFPYDWRLSVDDVAANTSLIDTLKHLAASSKTGKVTIVAHSEGGLVAKALMSRLGDEASKYVNKIVLVGVPQIGTPEAVAGLLHGYDQGIPFTLSQSAARNLGVAMPGAYALLPSKEYFSLTTTPMIKIHSALSQWYGTYGGQIDSADGLRTFLVDTSGKETSGTSADTTRPALLSQTLLAQAQALHDTIDNWVPPQGVQVTQIAGWGMNTLSSIEYGSNHLAPDTLTMKAHYTAGGDGVVPIESALALSAGDAADDAVQSVWFDLKRYNADHKHETVHGLIPFNHANLLDIPELDDFIAGAATTSAYLSTVDTGTTVDTGSTVDMSTSTADVTDTSMADDAVNDAALLDSVDIPDTIQGMPDVSTSTPVASVVPRVVPVVIQHALHLTLFRIAAPLDTSLSAILDEVSTTSTPRWVFEDASTTISY